MKLPSLPYSGNYSTSAQTVFGGLNDNIGATDGEIIFMENMTGEFYPVMRSRRLRGILRTRSDPRTLWAEDDLVEVYGTTLTINGSNDFTVSGSPKIMARMLRKLIIFPDKKIIDLDTMTMTSMESTTKVSGVMFKGGEIFGESAEANTIYKQDANWGQYFKVGDAVNISGATIHPENNKRPIVREIDGDTMRFYEYTFTLDPMWSYTPGTRGLDAGTYHFSAGDDSIQFTLGELLPYGGTLRWTGSSLIRKVGGVSTTIPISSGSGGIELSFQQTDVSPYTEPGELTFSREVPDLEFICVNENRLWGCKGDSIWASKLGDPTNFYVYDGLSTDSWQSDVGDKGNFTACISYLGYPMFFKEESVIKVYGDKPSNFQWTPSARFGVAEGSHLSLAVANETLFYLSPAGIVAYSGGIPTVISDPLGVDYRWRDAVAGSDGIRYYVSMQNQTNNLWSIFVYDTRHGLWHRQDNTRVVGFAWWKNEMYLFSNSGQLINMDNPVGTTERTKRWEVEFADATEGSPLKKGVLRLLIRLEKDNASTVTAKIMYDSDQNWTTVRTIPASTQYEDNKKHSYVLPVVVRRCDHWRLNLSGIGDVAIYSIAQTRYVGSEKQNS